MLANLPPFIIGGAQLGMSYGIANQTGKPALSQTKEMVDYAISQGLTWFDTAQDYGDSELVIGSLFSEVSVSPTILSKLNTQLQPTDTAAILEAIRASLHRLSIVSLWAIQLHRGAWLSYWKDGLGDALKQAKEAGLVSYIGVSIYDLDEAEQALDNDDIDIIQCPFNAWDPMLITSSFIDRAKAKKKLLLFRSVFLQGVLVMTPQQVQEKLPQASTVSQIWHDLSQAWQISPQALAIRYVRSFGCPMILGMETVSQLKTNCELVSQPVLDSDQITEIQRQIHPLINDNIVNPTRW